MKFQLTILLLIFIYASTSARATDLIRLYKELHQNPEVSFKEKQTRQRIAKELERLGVKVTHPISGEGLVGIYENGNGPTVLVRADLDALPITEKTEAPFKSQNKGVMHACGHDIHMTVLVGTARRLIEKRKEWSGTVLFIGQPAEERGGGAKALLKEGLFERFPRPNFNLALHVSSDLPSGSVGFVSGYAMANVDSVDVTLYGVGGHGAYPEKSTDPILMAAELITSLQSIVSRELAPTTPAVVTVGSIHAGTKHNIIPDSAHLQLTVRSYSDKSRHTILQAIKRKARGVATSHGLPDNKMPKVVIQDEYTPALYNNPELTQRIRNVLASLLGEKSIFMLKPEMIGEDFSRYGKQTPAIPSLMFRLGSVKHSDYQAFISGDKQLPTLHSAYYLPDAEKTIKTGIATMSAAVIELTSKR